MERVNSGGTALPLATVQLILRVCEHFSIPTTVAVHGPTLSAAQTQAVLPKGCLVQKTVTGRVAGKIILWTGVGDFRLGRLHYKMANRLLGLPAGRDHTLNPPDVLAKQFYGVQPGMVSPFLVPQTPAGRALAAVFVLGRDAQRPWQSVAISLSLTQSLVLPLQQLDVLLRTYAAIVYPQLPVFWLE